MFQSTLLSFPHSLSAFICLRNIKINLGKAKNQTRGCWVRSANATSMLCRPPRCPYFCSSRKNRERRENVISELVVTEREFCRDLKLTWQAFGLDTPAMLEQRGVDVPTLFGNVGDVIDISERFLDTLQVGTHYF